MPALTLATVLQGTSLVASTTLLALSIATVCLVTHYTTRIDERIPAGTYTWYGPLGSSVRAAYWAAVDAGRKDFDKVQLEYVTSNDIWVLVSGCVGLVAGFVGWLTVCFMMRKEKNPKTAGSRFPWVLACSIFFGLAAFAMSLTSTIITSQTKANLQGWTCIPHSAYTPDNKYFVCTRELAACYLFENIYMEDMSWSEQMCSEARASRMMLVPTLVCANVLIGVWVAQAVLGRKRATAVANMRVERLQQDEE